MKKITFFTVFALFVYFSVKAQPCLPEGITFITQTETDDFQTNYPNCTEIEEVCETLSVDENDLSDKLYIYPNPSSTQITIELPNTPKKNTMLSIQNINGRQFLTQSIIN